MNRFAALLAIVSCTASVAYAHNTQLSSAKLQIAGTLVMADIDMNGRDLEVALGRRLLGADGAVRPAALAEAAGAVAGYLTERLILGTRDVHCRLRVASLEPVAEHVRVRAEFPCPRFSGALVYRATLFTEVDPRARHMVTVTGDTKRFALLSVTTPTLEITSVRESPWVVCGRYLLAGIEHIAIGFDHVAFLLVTIVWARRFVPLLQVITAFTVAHSITLSLAVFGVVAVPSAWIEAGIAASIVYVAVENFFVRDVRRRWPLTFAFGLIHGFGFAGVLGDYGVPPEALVPALAGFNQGVEIGQVGIVSATLLVLHGIDRVQRRLGAQEIPDPRIAWAVSAAVGALGLWLLVDRLWGALAPG